MMLLISGSISWGHGIPDQHKYISFDISTSDTGCWNKVEAFTSHYGSYEVENHGSSEHLTAAQCLYRAFMSSGGQNMNSH